MTIKKENKAKRGGGEALNTGARQRKGALIAYPTRRKGPSQRGTLRKRVTGGRDVNHGPVGH